MKVELQTEFSTAYPGFGAQFVSCSGLRQYALQPVVDALVQELEKNWLDGWQPRDEESTEIAGWYLMYRTWGVNPRRMRPSVDALSRRFAKSGQVPRINPVVDLYNIASLRYGLPGGGFDMDRIDGDIHVRFATSDDTFVPIGGRESAPEVLEPREPVYSDEWSVLTRSLNHRDAEKTKIGPDSTSILLILEAHDWDGQEQAVDGGTQLLEATLAPHAITVSRGAVHATQPSLDLDDLTPI